MEEKQLVILTKSGDKEAFCELYSAYKTKLYRYAFYRLGNADDAEDAVSDAVVCSFQQLGSLRKPEAFSAWIFRILYCSCNTIIKAQINRRNMMSLEENSGVLSSELENAIEKTELQEALSILRDDEREIVLLSVVSGLSSKEIAKICDLTSGAVRSKLSRSLGKMRKFLGD